MSEKVHEQLMAALKAASGRYYRLVLLVGQSGSGKTGALADIARELGLTVTNLNLELSARLLDLNPVQRSSGLLLDNLRKITEQTAEPVLLDNMEILFDPSLKHDPLKLLQHVAKNKTILATWNGSCESGRLQYAEPGHREYRSYDAVDALLVAMQEQCGVDNEIC